MCACATTIAINASAASIQSDTWNTHYNKYDSHMVDDVYVTYYGNGFKAKITSKSGGYDNYVKIRAVKADKNTSLLYDRLSSVDYEVDIPSTWVRPVAGLAHFTVSLDYATYNPNETINNYGVIRINQ